VLICGPPGTGRAKVARTIHYNSAVPADSRLVPVDCAVATDESLRRAIDAAGNNTTGAARTSLLFERIETLSPAHQSLIAEALRRGAIAARILATCNHAADNGDVPAGSVGTPPALLDRHLRDLISTIEIHLPRLCERIDDLPLLAQFFLETSNQGKSKQIGAVRPEALDLLALYSWPGELVELRDVIASAHRAATPPAIGPADLPPIVFHAAKAAATPRRQHAPIDLDQFLVKIEKEAITRALAQAGGNKTVAAELLGLTRPRLYRRLEQLRIASESKEAQPHFEPLPDFREIDPSEDNE
jgi:DNA-binding NtrC family response regulator